MRSILLAILSSIIFQPASSVPERWVIDRSSNLCIEGKSNIAPFACDVVEYIHADTICLDVKAANSHVLTIKGGLRIDIDRIDCHQRYITTDLRKTLHADKIPLLRIELISIENFSEPGTKTARGVVVIDLAGVSRKMDIQYEIKENTASKISLVGKREILFTDFNLKAPHKLAGMVKVDNELQIRFNLILKLIHDK